MNQLPIVPGRAGEQFEFLSSALSHSIHWLPYLALTSRCQLAMASAMAAPSPRISRACVNGLNLAFPAALSKGLHSPLWAYAWVGSRSDDVCALALTVSIAVTSAAKAPRKSIDFGIIDTTPSLGFKFACIHCTPHTQHSRFVRGEPRNASALKGRTRPIAARHLRRTRLVFGSWFLIFFWAVRDAALRNTPLCLRSTAHVNQKSFDMTTPNDKSGRCSRLVPAHIVRATRE